MVVALRGVRQKAGGAVLNAVFHDAKIAAASAAQRVKRAIAEKAVEALGVAALVAGEILARSVAEETKAVFHSSDGEQAEMLK